MHLLPVFPDPGSFRRWRPCPTRPSSQPATGDIGLEKAKEIALSHAGATPNEASALRAEQDRKNGMLVYEVGFFIGNAEYDYTIHAATGTILSVSVELRGA